MLMLIIFLISLWVCMTTVSLIGNVGWSCRFYNASLSQEGTTIVESQEQWLKIDSRHLTIKLKRFIKGNLNGLFLTVNCVNLLDWLLLKSCCLHIDLSLNVLGTFQLSYVVLDKIISIFLLFLELFLMKSFTLMIRIIKFCTKGQDRLSK